MFIVFIMNCREVEVEVEVAEVEVAEVAAATE